MDIKEKLLKFFKEYKNLFREGMSSGDADDILMSLILIIEEQDVETVINYLKGNDGGKF